MSQLPITRVPTSSIRRLEYPFLTSYCLLVLEQMSMLFVGMISTDSRLWAAFCVLGVSRLISLPASPSDISLPLSI